MNTGPSICILAAKDLRSNTRIQRQANALARDGFQVTIGALELPIDLNPAVVTRRIQLSHPLRKLEQTRIRAQTPSSGGAVVDSDAAARAQSGGTVKVLRKLILPVAPIIARLQFRQGVMSAFANTQFDFIQAHDTPALLAANALCERQGGKLIYDAVEFTESRHFHANGRIARLARRWEFFTDARMIKKTQLCFAIGPSMADWMSKRYGISQPLVVRNCRSLNPPPQSVRIRQDCKLDHERLVLYLNSIGPGRGVEQFIDALGLLNNDIHAGFVGSVRNTQQREQLLDYADQRDVRQRIHLLPSVTPNDLVDYISGADAGVIPLQNTHLNHFFALPNRVFELIMARVPIAASSFPDMKSVIESFEIGATFDPEDPASIADSIQRVLEHAPQQQAIEARERAAQTLCWENESKAYIESLKNLVKD